MVGLEATLVKTSGKFKWKSRFEYNNPAIILPLMNPIVSYWAKLKFWLQIEDALFPTKSKIILPIYEVVGINI